MAAAAVANRRKRGAGAFLDDGGPFSLPQLQAKRGRCSPSAVDELGFSLESKPLESLQLIFAGADPEALQGHYEASGNVLDAAITTFKDYLASRSETTRADASSSSGGTSDGPVMNTPTNAAEWAELIVREVLSSSDLIDAKNRAFRILELIEKSAASFSTPDEMQKMREEHKILKQMLGGLLHQNGILKRAVLIQHNRLKDYPDMVQERAQFKDMVRERAQFKEIVDKYQRQIKMLEDKNYILSFHLAQSNKEKTMFGPRNPDVF